MNTVNRQPGGKKEESALPRFRFFPNWRMDPGFPWPIWSVGWLAVIKALLWVSSNPVVPEPLATYLFAKFAVAMIPFLVLGVGLWNLRKWAAWGLIVAAAADLAFFIVFPNAWRFLTAGSFWALAALLLVFNGPIGNVLILAAGPVLLKTAGRHDLLDTAAR